MNLFPIVLGIFNGKAQERSDALKDIERYVHWSKAVMMYRSNNLIHSRRVLWHLEAALDDIVEVFPRFNVPFARTLALVHDDGEIITGDPQLYDVVRMSVEEHAELREKDRRAIPELVRRFGDCVNGFSYERLLQTAKDKDCLEAQFVSLFDKFDGFGEALHEVFAGNPYFMSPACLEKADPNTQNGGYIKRIGVFPEKYPDMAPFFERFGKYLPPLFDFTTALQEGRPHTLETVQYDSGYAPYERWKRNVIKHEGGKRLTTQVEYWLPQLPEKIRRHRVEEVMNQLRV